MNSVLLFGGTSEGRMLAELLKELNIPALVCIATQYGETLLSPGGSLRIHAGRLDANGIAALAEAERPRCIIDATHPYALQISEALRAVCECTHTEYIRVKRKACETDGCVEFEDMSGLLSWLNARNDVIFSTLGAKEARALTKVSNFKSRVWLRILPSAESLNECLHAGYPAQHIICMQGPFSTELNTAMLRFSGATVLLSKESGSSGGFLQKIEAARALGISAAVLQRPVEQNGLYLFELEQRIKDGAL